MSFQFENSYTTTHHLKTKPLGSGNLLGDHHGDVLISKVIPITLNLFDINQSPPRLKPPEPCFAFARGTSLDSKSKRKRSFEDHLSEENMSRRNGNNNNNNNVPKLDLKLNLSLPSSRMRITPNLNPRMESPTRSPSVSPPSSCVSSDLSSPESTRMVLVGCPRCLMYVMLPEDDPKCPKCKSTVLLDVHDENNNCNISGGSSKKIRKG